MIQSATEKIVDSVSSFIGMLSRNPRVITISLIVGGIFVALGLFFSRRRKEFKAKKETTPSQETKKIEEVADKKLTPSLPEKIAVVSTPSTQPDAFMKQVAGQSFAALLGTKKMEDISNCKSDDLKNLHLEHPIEKGISKEGWPFIAVQVHYDLTVEDIARMQRSIDRDAPKYLAKPKGNSHAIFVQLEVDRWRQQALEIYPLFFWEFSPAKQERFSARVFELFRALIETGQCQDMDLKFTWYLGHE